MLKYMLRTYEESSSQIHFRRRRQHHCRFIYASILIMYLLKDFRNRINIKMFSFYFVYSIQNSVKFSCSTNPFRHNFFHLQMDWFCGFYDYCRTYFPQRFLFILVILVILSSCHHVCSTKLASASFGKYLESNIYYLILS